jgi:hypothetical protein
MAPPAQQRASFEKYRGSNAGTVVQGVFLDFKNGAFDRTAPWSHGIVKSLLLFNSFHI